RGNQAREDHGSEETAVTTERNAERYEQQDIAQEVLHARRPEMVSAEADPIRIYIRSQREHRDQQDRAEQREIARYSFRPVCRATISNAVARLTSTTLTHSALPLPTQLGSRARRTPTPTSRAD